MREQNDRPDDLPVELVPAAAEALERAERRLLEA